MAPENRDEVRQRIDSLYDQAENATGTFNATRAMAVRRRSRGVPLAKAAGQGGDPGLDEVARQWFEGARARLGPTVPAVLPADRLPGRPAAPAPALPRQPHGEGTGALAGGAREVLEPGPSGRGPLALERPTDRAAAELPAGGPVAALPAGGPVAALPAGGAVAALPGASVVAEVPGGGAVAALPAGGAVAALPGGSAVEGWAAQGTVAGLPAHSTADGWVTQGATTGLPARSAVDGWATRGALAELPASGPVDGWAPQGVVAGVPGAGVIAELPGRNEVNGWLDLGGTAVLPVAAPSPAPAEPVVAPGQATTTPAGAPGPEALWAPRAAKAIAFARAQIGKPCVWGATGPDSYDCASLVQAAWKAAGVELPRAAHEQALFGAPVTTAGIQPGDLVLFFDDDRHVGLHIGGGMMVHAPGPGSTIREESIYGAGESAIHRIVRPA